MSAARRSSRAGNGVVLLLLGLCLALSRVSQATSNAPPCGNPPKPPPPTNCTHSSSNPFDPYSGSVGRGVTDLEVSHSVGEVPLRFARYHASRWDVNPGFDLPYEKPFGDGGNWRHRFQWTVLDNGTNEAGQLSIRLVYPYGFYGNFAKADSNATHLTYLADTHERVLEQGTNYYLIMLDGTRYHFTSWTNEAERFYRMEGFLDPYSNRYNFIHTDDRLTRVMGPNTNLCLDLNYTTLTNSQPPGEIQFTFADNLATQVLLAGTFNDWTGQDMTNSAGVWYRAVELTNGVYEYKFVARYAGQPDDVWHSDPDNPLYTLPFSNSAANIQSNPAAATVLASVTASDGRSVSYQYQSIWGAGLVHVALTNAAYGDGHSAAYTYYHPSEDWDRRPLLKTADDPHYGGPARAILYLYQTNNIYPGQIYEERSLVNSQLLARLELDGVQPRRRRVTLADGRQEAYTYGTNTGQILVFTNAVGYVSQKEYFLAGDSEGMLAKEVDPMGRTTTYSRTWHFGAVTLASNSVRGVRRFFYTDNNNPFHLSAEVDEAGRTNRYTRDSRNRITRHDYPDGSYETFTYNDHGQILNHRRRDGGVWSYEYDARGRKVRETDPLGHQTHYAYDSYDRLAIESNALGHTTRHFYNWRGQVTNIVHSDGTEEKTWYDRYGQATQQLNRAGGYTAMTYNELGHLASTRDPLGHETHYRHDVEGRLITVSNAIGLVISNAYDGIGRKVRETYSTDGTYHQWHYDPDGVRTQFNRLGLPITFTYTPEGQLRRVTDPLGRSTSFGYDVAGNRTHVTNAMGDVTTHTYDPAGRVTSTRSCSGAVVSNCYDEGGRLVRQIDPNSITNVHTYDALGRVVSVGRVGPNAPLILATNRYDALGRLIWQQDANGLARSNTYDAAGRLLRTYMPDSAFYENQYSNTFLVQTADRAGRQTLFQRDVLGRVTNQIDNAGQSVRFAYDALGRLTRLHDQNDNLTRFQYDAEGRQTAKLYADDSQYTYSYDAEGRLLSRLDAKSKLTAYQYDHVGNLTNIAYSSDSPVAFSYDALNRMTRMADGIGTTLYTYAGSCGALGSVDGPFPNDTLTYTYDPGKRLTSISSALSASSAGYSYDPLDRIASVVGRVGPNAPLTNTYAYHANGRLPSELIRGNGTRTRYAYDLLNRLTNLVHQTSTGGILSSFAYVLDAADQRTAVAMGGPGAPRTVNYAYDPIGQLTSAQGNLPGHAFNYAYDPSGNPTFQDNNGFLLTNAFNDLNQNVTSLWSGTVTVLGTANITNGQITVQGGPAASRADGLGGAFFAATNLPVSGGTNIYTALLTDPFGRVDTSAVSVIAQNRGYGYDANGNMTNDGQFAYVWDEADRLTEVRKGNEVVMTCKYDGLGRRRERVLLESGTGVPPVYSTNRYIYDGWLVVAITDGSTNVLETYTHGPDLSGTLGGAGGIGGILSCSSGSVSRFFHYDGNGNVVTISDTNQTIVATYEYSPFGQTLVHTGPYHSRYRFSSKEWDGPVGLYYYGYRFYSPGLGRWFSRDLIGCLDGPNLYAFVGNTPNNSADDLGLMKGSFGPPSQAPEIISHFSSDVFGRTFVSIVENSCSCACKNGSYELSCTLSLVYQISMATQNSPVWNTMPKSYPTDPTPPDWLTWNFARKYAKILDHEQRHVANFRNWYYGRRRVIESFEQLVYPNKAGCDQRAADLVHENETGLQQKKIDENNHVGW